MKILGDIMERFLTLLIFKIILVLYTLFLAVKLIVSTGVENIFGLLELLQVKKEKLKEDVKKYGKESFSREIISLHKTRADCNYEETRQLFLNNVLKESLDDGTPAFYNSNILGRYLRKDYGNFGRDSSSDS